MQRNAMKLALTICLLTLVVLLAGTNPATAPLALGHSKEGEDSDNSGPGKFEERIAGTYLIKFDREDEDPTFQRIVTLTADGNWLSVDLHQEEIRFMDQQGVYKRTGRREITAKVLNFNYAPGGGFPTGVTRLRFDVTFTSDFQELSGEMFGETFEPGENPLDPEGPPLDTFEATFEGQRVTVDD